MDTARWESVKDLLLQALQLTPEERDPFLNLVGASDASLRAELESLLAAGDEVRSTFMQSPAIAEGLSPVFAGLQSGQMFAQRFQLVRKLGEGGMGQVWLAEQAAPVRRQVALKLIKAGMYDEALVQRFQSERQSLAIMDHPAIAKVFEAGATEQGQPYFAMEYVPGAPITDSCDQHKRNIRERLQLFIPVCEGVQHAHQKSMLHRDLKPANILVVEIDGKPAPRIIDFGLAKTATKTVDGENAFTQLGSFVGTPGYMSPEQADPVGQDVDTRTDVYSLGVVLYLLLTGSLPLDLKDWRKQSLAELLRKLREEEPLRPSHRVGASDGQSKDLAAARRAESRQLVSQLRGDLDWITMKALEKDRTRRYGTPAELAADIRRYLNSEPVLARPASAGYRLQKYVQRHRLAVAAAATLLLILIGFAILQAVQLRRITRERDRANRITDFMVGMFKLADPSETRGNSVTAREILDRATGDLDNGLAKDPEVQAEMMAVMARSYSNLGLYPRALVLAQRAMNERINRLGPKDAKTLESMTELGLILQREGHDAEAEKLERQAMTALSKSLGYGNVLTIESMNNLAVILEDEGHYDEAQKLAQQAVDLGTPRLGAENTEILRSMDTLNLALWYQARYAEAERGYRNLVEIEGRVLGPEHPRTLRAVSNLAMVLQSQNRFSEAEPLYREVVAAEQKVLGTDHPLTANAMENLATVLTAEGNGEAEKLHRQALDIRMRVEGPEHRDTLVSELNLSDELFRQGHIEEAEKLQRETIATQIRALGPEDADTLGAQADLAKTLIREGRYEEAETIARKTFEIQLRTLGLQHPETLDTLQRLGTAMALEHRYAEAEAWFQDVIAKNTDPAAQANLFSAWYAFARVAAAANRPDDALRYLREAIQRGYKDADGLLADDDLKSLRENARFQELIADLRGTPAAMTR